MWLKIVIVILFVGLVISLFTSLGFLFKDQNAEESSRTWSMLNVRIALAVLLIGFLFYGVFTGQLGSHAPWDARYQDELPKLNQAAPAPAEDIKQSQ